MGVAVGVGVGAEGVDGDTMVADRVPGGYVGWATSDAWTFASTVASMSGVDVGIAVGTTVAGSWSAQAENKANTSVRARIVVRERGRPRIRSPLVAEV